MNALNMEVRMALFEALAAFRDDDDVRVVVLTGAGEKAFIAGADIGEFKDAGAVEQYRSMQRTNIYSAMEDFPKPIIAMINGYCLGGGCELSMACDIRVASSRARLGQPEINLGIIPGGGGTQRLPRLVGEGHANRLIMTGEMVSAEEAARGATAAARRPSGPAGTKSVSPRRWPTPAMPPRPPTSPPRPHPPRMWCPPACPKRSS